MWIKGGGRDHYLPDRTRIASSTRTTDFTALKRSVSPQSTLFLYSDGITESTDEAGNEFDVKPLAETLLQSRNLIPCEMVEMVHRAIVGYDHGAELSDDRTMLALRWAPKGMLNHAAL